MHTGRVEIVRARRLGPPALLLLALLAGCTSEPGLAGRAGSASPSPSPEASSSEPSAGSPTPTESRSEAPSRSPHPVSLEALIAKRYDGRGLRLVRQIAATDAYRQYDATYRSGDLTITGRVNVPLGKGPFPAVVLAHGYIDPAVYVSGQGLMREQDWLARAGYVTLHVDYRNHAGSDDDPACGAATPPRLHRGRHQRGAGPAPPSVAGRRRPDRAGGPVHGRRGRLQHARRAARVGRRGRRVRAGQLGHRRQLRAVDPSGPGPGGARAADHQRATGRPSVGPRSGAVSAHAPTSTGSRSR